MFLIIDNYDSFTFNLYQLLAALTPNVMVVRNDKISLVEIFRMPLQGIILSPGPGRPENAGICVPLIQALAAKKITYVSLLGVCLGHQALISAFSGKVIRAHEIVHGKSDGIFHSASGLYQNMPQGFKAGRYHSLIAEKNQLPENISIEAENASGMIMGVRHKNLPMYGVQFHPESILTPQGNLLLQNFINLSVTGGQNAA